MKIPSLMDLVAFHGPIAVAKVQAYTESYFIELSQSYKLGRRFHKKVYALQLQRIAWTRVGQKLAMINELGLDALAEIQIPHIGSIFETGIAVQRILDSRDNLTADDVTTLRDFLSESFKQDGSVGKG
jgi:hypothetical protein